MKIKKILIVSAEILLILAVFVGTIYMVKQRDTNRVFVNKYADFVIEYADGTDKHSDSQNFGTVNRGDLVTVHLKLPQEPIMDDAVLTFFIYHSVTEVRCDGELLAAYGADIAAKGKMIGNNHFRIDVPDAAWGGEITITLQVTENGAFNRVKNLGLYPAQHAYEYFFDMDLVGFFIGLPMLLVGLVAILIFLLNRKSSATNRKILYIALFAILASLWVLTTKGVEHLFGFDQYFWTQLEFVSAFTLVIPVLLWAFETAEKGSRMRRIMGGAALVNAAYFAVCTVLHLTNMAHYCATLLVSNLLTLISGILLVIFAAGRQRRGQHSDRIFFNGMLIMFAAGLFDLLRMNIYKYLPWLLKASLPSVLAMGMLFFVVYLLRAYMAESAEKQKKLITAEVTAQSLTEMVDSIPAGICLFRLDKDLSIIRANDTFFGIFGYSQAEAAAAGFDDLMFPLNEEERARLRQQDLTLLNNGEARSYEIELAIRKANGEPAVILSKYYFHGKDDRRVTANVIDITDRKRMEELMLSEKRYRLALTQSGKVFFFFDVPTRTMRLSDELAQAFGLPNEVDDMPDNMLAQGLVEPASEANYRHFYERIIAGEESGDTVISCHMRQAPEQVLWYKIAFTSVFDTQGLPTSAIITYEDLSARRSSELAAQWKQLNLVSVPEREYVIAEYDLTRDRIISQVGGLFAKTPEFLTGFDEIGEFVLTHFVYDEDVADYRRFLDRERLLERFANGLSEDAIEYRALQSGSTPRWTATSLQMIRDPYSGNVMAQMLFRDIHAEKTGQIEMQQSMEELQTELENSRIKVMINQMQPHFLYNALSAIQTIVKTDQDYAYQLLYDFTVHLRSSIKALSSDAPIPFKDELKNIKAYLNIERMRFGDALKVQYEIDCDDFSIIPLSIQPLAENAARHGVYPQGEDGGTVTVRTYETAAAYVVEVEDDGMGFDVNEALTGKSDSVGLKNLIFRLKSLMNADVNIDSRPGLGTKVTVTIPKEGV